VRAPSQRVGLGVLFGALTVLFAAIALAAASAGQWVIALAAAPLALWLASLAAGSLRPR
jgi:hypothetical protein